VSSFDRGSQIGRYVITGVIGRGGMGVVYAAHDPTLDRRVALKLIDVDDDPAGADRLVREARALAKLSDPHVVTVYDAGEHAGQVFIAMQLVDGEDLGRAVATREPPPEQILSWFYQAGLGLAAAHDAGLVHRDFKPSNVLIDRQGRVAVTDFGLARTIGSTPSQPPEERLTRVGAMPGTPAYMSPEQHTMQPATALSDQFSFCVALWEAIMGQHPFIEGARESMAPFAIGYAIYDGPLLMPAKIPVAKAVLDALMRGLDRDPTKRFPDMRALLTALEPPSTKRVWPYAVSAAITLGGLAIAGVWVALDHAGPEGASCDSIAQARTAAIWSTATQGEIGKQFAATQRPYAAQAAGVFDKGIDRYVTAWQSLATDTCTVQRGERPTPELERSDLATRRAACLELRLEALRGLVELVRGEARPEFVDRASGMVDGLPDIDDCADASSVAAPPPALAPQVASLEHELDLADARVNGGDYEQGTKQLQALVPRIDAVDWPPLQARAHTVLGLALGRLFRPSRDELGKAAALAVAHHDDREAARALAAEVLAAGYDAQPDAVSALAPLAKAYAERTGDAALIVDADIAYGRALVRVKRYKDAVPLCKAALAEARTKLDGTKEVDTANDCLVESLGPSGAIAELSAMLDALIADREKRLGKDHPQVADFLTVQATIEMRTGKLEPAFAKAERILAIRRKAFPANHVKIAEALSTLVEVEIAQGKVADAKRDAAEALGIADAWAKANPTAPTLVLTSLHTRLATLAQATGDHAGAVTHYQQAADLLRARPGGAESLELAVLLLNYGQVRAADNIEAGIGLVGEAHAILDRLGDPRAALATPVLAELYVQGHRYADARKLLEGVHVDAATQPDVAAMVDFDLAQSLAETGGSETTAHQLATDARALLAKLGPGQAADLKRIDVWLAKHP
jgi:tetratricopeptide (TPR) repeat protein